MLLMFFRDSSGIDFDTAAFVAIPCYCAVGETDATTYGTDGIIRRGVSA